MHNCYFYENQIADLGYIQQALRTRGRMFESKPRILINMEIRVMMMFCIFHLSVVVAVIKTWNYQILYQRNCFYLLAAIVSNFLINLNLIPVFQHRPGWYKLIKSLLNFKHHRDNIILYQKLNLNQLRGVFLSGHLGSGQTWDSSTWGGRWQENAVRKDSHAWYPINGTNCNLIEQTEAGE